MTEASYVANIWKSSQFYAIGMIETENNTKKAQCLLKIGYKTVIWTLIALKSLTHNIYHHLIPTHLYIECDNMKCSFAERNHITNTPITSFCSENSRNKKCLEDFYRDMLHKEKRKRGAQKMFISKCGDTTQNVLHWSFRTSQIKH